MLAATENVLVLIEVTDRFNTRIVCGSWWILLLEYLQILRAGCVLYLELGALVDGRCISGVPEGDMTLIPRSPTHVRLVYQQRYDQYVKRLVYIYILYTTFFVDPTLEAMLNSLCCYVLIVLQVCGGLPALAKQYVFR